MDKTFGEKLPGVQYNDRIGAYLICFLNDKIAVIKTSKGCFLPGGGCENGESYEECICREVKEETGFEVSNLSYCSCAEEYILHETIGDFHPIQYYYAGTLTNKKCEPTETDHKLVWLTVDGIENKLYSAAQGWAVNFAFSQRQRTDVKTAWKS